MKYLHDPEGDSCNLASRNGTSSGMHESLSIFSSISIIIGAWCTVNCDVGRACPAEKTFECPQYNPCPNDCGPLNCGPNEFV